MVIAVRVRCLKSENRVCLARMTKTGQWTQEGDRPRASRWTQRLASLKRLSSCPFFSWFPSVVSGGPPSPQAGCKAYQSSDFPMEYCHVTVFWVSGCWWWRRFEYLRGFPLILPNWGTVVVSQRDKTTGHRLRLCLPSERNSKKLAYITLTLQCKQGRYISLKVPMLVINYMGIFYWIPLS